MPANFHLAIEKRFAAFLDDRLWVCWKEISRAGRKTKLPIDAASGKAASATRPGTWSTYWRASQRMQKTGIGIVLTRTQPGLYLAGIDVDSCRDPGTGTVAPWASSILDGIVSYAEISPSGTGLKIFALMAEKEWIEIRDVFGPGATGAPRLGRSWKERGSPHPAGVEIYLGARYFAVTGTPWRDDAINRVSASDLRQVMDYCSARFGRLAGTVRIAGVARTDLKDFTESGRAFRACLAAVRAGVALEDVPQWAAQQKDATGTAKYDVSREYWDRPRAEGTQLVRDFVRAKGVIGD